MSDPLIRCLVLEAKELQTSCQRWRCLEIVRKLKAQGSAEVRIVALPTIADTDRYSAFEPANAFSGPPDGMAIASLESAMG
jgi:hypothetical protein